MDWKNTWFWRQGVRLAKTYWGRVLLLTPSSAVLLATMYTDPQYAQLRYSLLMIAVVLVCAAQTSRQMHLAAMAMFVYAGSRVRWAFEEPGIENWVLLAVPLLVAGLCAWMSWNYPSMGLGPLLGWIGVPDGRQLPVIFAPCACGWRKLHFQVMAIGGEIEFTFGDDYTVNVPKGPPVLNYNLIMRREVDGRRFLRSLDARC